MQIRDQASTCGITTEPDVATTLDLSIMYEEKTHETEHQMLNFLRSMLVRSSRKLIAEIKQESWSTTSDERKSKELNMLKISKLQLNEMARQNHNLFLTRLVRHLRRTYAQRLDEMSDDALLKFVQTITSMAPRWGLHKECEVAEIAMLVLEIKFVTGLEAMPEWFAQTVRDPELNPASKLHQLVRQWHEKLAGMRRRSLTSFA